MTTYNTLIMGASYGSLQSMSDLFRHRGGATVVAVVLSITGWAILAGLAYLLWSLF